MTTFPEQARARLAQVSTCGKKKITSAASDMMLLPTTI